MITKERIIFADDILVGVSCQDKQEIIDAVYEAATRAINDLGIFYLSRIVITQPTLFEETLGKARMFGENAEITLSFGTAAWLRKTDVTEKHKDALATLYHELNHILDYERIGKQLLKRSTPPDIKEGYDIWTEFYATYSTFDIHEQHHVYESFKSSIFPRMAEKHKVKYHTSRLLGYALKPGCLKECDELVCLHLSRKHVEMTKELLQSLINHYPEIRSGEFVKLKELVEKCIPGEFDVSELGEEVDILSEIRRRSKHT